MRIDVSVVLPTRHGRLLFGECLESLAKQTMSPDRFEVVVVQNGRTDGTELVLALARSRYPWLRLRSVSTSMPGGGRARNVGLEAARGEYVTFVDDDDLVTPEYLAGLHAQSRPTRIGLAGTVDLTTTAGMANLSSRLEGWQRRLDEGVLPAEALPSALSSTTAKMLPTELARAVRFDEDLRSGEDVLFWAGVLGALPFDWGLCPVSAHALYLRRPRPDSIARQVASYDFSITQRLQVIERLLARRSSEPSHAPVVHYLVGEQVALMNRHLRVHPEEHAQTLKDIASRGLDDFPFARLNEGVARHLAILYVALPYADTSALVAARRIREAGVPVDVVSSDMSSMRHRDPEANLVWREYLDTIRETKTRPCSAWWPGLADFCRQGMAAIDAAEAVKGEYFSVYSRAMWPASHLLGALYKARHPDVPWTAEFSDPLIHNVYGDVRTSSGRADQSYLDEIAQAIRRAGFQPPADDNVYTWCEYVVYALADRILFTNAHQRDYMLGYLPDRDLAERGRTVGVIESQPTLPEDFYRAVDVDYDLPEGRLNIAYFGVFYPTRGLTEVIEGLNRLTPDERSRVRIHVFTVDPDKLAEEAQAHGLADVIVANGYVTYLEFLRLTTRFDVLLVNDARTRDSHSVNPYMPSKYSDYAGSGTPIWGVVEPGSQLSSRPLAYRSELGDAEGAAAVIRTALAITAGR